MKNIWYLRQLLILLLSALILIGVFQFTDLDLQLSRYFYDPELGRFSLQHQWFLSYVMHHGLKAASYILVAAALYFCWLGYKGQLWWLPRANALLAGLGMLLIPVAVTLLKTVTNRHCPWDMVEFGGFVPYQHLLSPPLPGSKAGQCFPAGHASAGFLWLVWGLALRPAGRHVARIALLAGVGLGLAMGVGRIMQGAHFLSHTLWTFWCSWAIAVFLAWALKARLCYPASEGPEDTEPDDGRANNADENRRTAHVLGPF